MKTTKDIQMEVMEVHNLFWESYARRDIELRFSLCSEDVTFIGSGLHERALNKTEYKNINKEGVKQFPDPFQIEFLWTNLSMINEIVACVESEVVWSQMINNEISTELLRNTTLLKYDNSKWLVTHVHGSVPDYRLKEGDYMTNEQTIIRNKELERQVFERTQDLNETLEKLEEKNRELEIEASLERVRAVAMSMNNSDDLLSICEVSFKEFKKLGFNNLRNAIIHIPNDKEKYFMDYDFSELTGGAITKIEYGSHPIVDEYLEKIKSAKDAYFEVVINEDQLEGWKDFRKKSSQMDDPRLNQATSLYYYLFSIGLGDIGISSFKPIIESQLIILKRFRNVFELAYQRYTDIEKAEAQAREAEIELSLERVRARTMAMQHSDELAEASFLLDSQVRALGIKTRGCAFNIYGENESKEWFSSEMGTMPMYKTPREKIFLRYYEEGQKGKPMYIESFTGDACAAHYDYLCTLPVMGEGLKEYKKSGGSFPTQQIDHVTYFKYGYLLFITLEPAPDAHDIFLRFAKVFEQTYTRFLDLQKAEAQAREAQIEAALERVRSRTMGMQKSEELKEVIQLVYEQFVHLNIHVEHTGFILDYKSRDDMYIWLADKHEVPSQITISYFDSPHWNSFIEAKAKGKDFFANHLDFEEKNKFYKDLFKLFPVPNKAKEYYFSCPGLAISTVLLDNVSLYIENFSGTPYSNEENAVLIRFAKVFEQAYIRFMDLQKAETQARKAQIEAALERTRTKSMLMQHSNELKNISNIFHEQLLLLGIPSEFSYVWLPDEGKGEHQFWATWAEENGTTAFKSKAITYPLDMSEPYTAACFTAWKSDKPVHIIPVPSSEVHQFFATWEELLCGAEQLKPEFFPEGLFYAEAYMKYGCFGINIRRELKGDEEEILRRFTVEFERAYTRFLDLQKAEAQNKIIQAENERKTKELEDARQLQLSMLPRELPKVSNLDIAVYMKTATEVGGDYYDFHIQPDGTLNVLVGDATGHGMMSGMMVSIMKSFFIANRYKIELKEFFENSNISIKDMQLGRLMMACIGVQITSQKVIATNAGMPSLLYFRNKSQKAGEFVINNMPLGAMKGTKYLLKEITYEKGDTLLLMSDGFAELKNKNEELYGYERVKEEFKSVVQKSADEIIDHFKNSSSEWANGIEPDDDITFVVIKVK